MEDQEATPSESPDLDPEYPPYLPETAKIPGWPGYRTRPTRSGYDYIDLAIEQAHMEGTFYRNFLRGQLVTTSPAGVVLLVLGGLLLLAFSIMSLATVVEFRSVSLITVLGAAFFGYSAFVFLWGGWRSLKAIIAANSYDD